MKRNLSIILTICIISTMLGITGYAKVDYALPSLLDESFSGKTAGILTSHTAVPKVDNIGTVLGSGWSFGAQNMSNFTGTGGVLESEIAEVNSDNVLQISTKNTGGGNWPGPAYARYTFPTPVNSGVIEISGRFMRPSGTAASVDLQIIGTPKNGGNEATIGRGGLTPYGELKMNVTKNTHNKTVTNKLAKANDTWYDIKYVYYLDDSAVTRYDFEISFESEEDLSSTIITDETKTNNPLVKASYDAKAKRMIISSKQLNVLTNVFNITAIQPAIDGYNGKILWDDLKVRKINKILPVRGKITDLSGKELTSGDEVSFMLKGINIEFDEDINSATINENTLRFLDGEGNIVPYTEESSLSTDKRIYTMIFANDLAANGNMTLDITPELKGVNGESVENSAFSLTPVIPPLAELKPVMADGVRPLTEEIPRGTGSFVLKFTEPIKDSLLNPANIKLMSENGEISYSEKIGDENREYTITLSEKLPVGDYEIVMTNLTDEIGRPAVTENILTKFSVVDNGINNLWDFSTCEKDRSMAENQDNGWKYSGGKFYIKDTNDQSYAKMQTTQEQMSMVLEGGTSVEIPFDGQTGLVDIEFTFQTNNGGRPKAELFGNGKKLLTVYHSSSRNAFVKGTKDTQATFAQVGGRANEYQYTMRIDMEKRKANVILIKNYLGGGSTEIWESEDIVLADSSAIGVDTLKLSDDGNVTAVTGIRIKDRTTVEALALEEIAPKTITEGAVISPLNSGLKLSFNKKPKEVTLDKVTLKEKGSDEAISYSGVYSDADNTYIIPVNLKAGKEYILDMSELRDKYNEAIIDADVINFSVESEPFAVENVTFSKGTKLVTSLAELTAGDTVKVSAEVKNDYSSAKKAVIFAMHMSGTGKIKKLACKTQNVMAGGENVEAELTLCTMEAGDFVRVFAWDKPSLATSISEIVDLR